MIQGREQIHKKMCMVRKFLCILGKKRDKGRYEKEKGECETLLTGIYKEEIIKD